MIAVGIAFALGTNPATANISADEAARKAAEYCKNASGFCSQGTGDYAHETKECSSADLMVIKNHYGNHQQGTNQIVARLGSAIVTGKNKSGEYYIGATQTAEQIKKKYGDEANEKYEQYGITLLPFYHNADEWSYRNAGNFVFRDCLSKKDMLAINEFDRIKNEIENNPNLLKNNERFYAQLMCKYINSKNGECIAQDNIATMCVKGGDQRSSTGYKYSQISGFNKDTHLSFIYLAESGKDMTGRLDYRVVEHRIMGRKDGKMIMKYSQAVGDDTMEVQAKWFNNQDFKANNDIVSWNYGVTYKKGFGGKCGVSDFNGKKTFLWDLSDFSIDTPQNYQIRPFGNFHPMNLPILKSFPIDKIHFENKKDGVVKCEEKTPGDVKCKRDPNYGWPDKLIKTDMNGNLYVPEIGWRR